MISANFLVGILVGIVITGSILFMLIPAESIPPTRAFSHVLINETKFSATSYDSYILLNPNVFNATQDMKGIILNHSAQPYAQLSSSENQPIGTVGMATNVTLNTNDEISKMTHNATTNNHIIEIDVTGIYYFIVCGQVGQSAGGGGSHLLWMQKNGVNIPNTAVETYISTPLSSTNVVTLNWVGLLNKGDEISFQQTGDDVNLNMRFTNASDVVSAIPSIIISIRGIAT